MDLIVCLRYLNLSPALPKMPIIVPPRDQEEQLPLSTSAEFLLDECRMVLPGIQALFGFQLIAVFNSGFSQTLDPFEQKLHLFALFLTTIAIAFVMTPAAFHRQTGPTKVTEKFICLATRLLLWGMCPLLIGLCIDFYLIARIITDQFVAALLTAAIGGLFVGLWFVLPHMNNRKRTPPE